MWTPWRKATPSQADPEPDVSATATAAAEAKVTELREHIAQIRSLADRSAKAIGAIAVALAGFLSITQLSDVFPVASSASPVAWYALAFGLCAITGGVACWIRKLGNVSAPVQIRADGEHGGLDPDETTAVNDALTDHAKLNGFDGRGQLNDAIYALERHILGYQPATQHQAADKAAAQPQADNATEEFAGTPAEQASRLALMKAEYQAARVAAAADVVRDRYSGAFRSRSSWGLMGAAAIGYVALALSLAYLAGESTGEIERAQQCADASKAAAEAKVQLVSPGCDALVKTPTEAPGAADDARRSATLTAYARAVEQASTACTGNLQTAVQRRFCQRLVDAIPAAPTTP